MQPVKLFNNLVKHISDMKLFVEVNFFKDFSVHRMRILLIISVLRMFKVSRILRSEILRSEIL